MTYCGSTRAKNLVKIPLGECLSVFHWDEVAVE